MATSEVDQRGRRKPLKGLGRWFYLLASIVICVVATGNVFAQSAGYTLDWFVLAGGGQASGGAYTVRGVAGQSTAGSLSGGTYSLSGGFLLAEPPAQTSFQRYLPVTIR
jgi:hypothetical protein